MASAETTNVISAIASFLRSSSHFLASSPLTVPRPARNVGRESLYEAEPLEQLPKLDVVVRNGAEYENQLADIECAHLL